ncbi:MAG: hypothetical protein COV30_00090 [Candidatus Yanofskybacteria bacterium CG10_big_fil_rev_8_21_14_0_10_37_15]|uniref:Helix-turn-helix domain-containing protein n=1 Tax=Candidatus Yanofskybacteria bacterium CG10_big_fil_rev_8_21_14_0_10_37_15 TaxID=1975097 RepID=A0A2H0R6J1_9BACT|nr:MAG: hypothetical protein COV30_00090 [Candidatus Yanofskybacteria bacterium CG10_big_fil_rev_8_21_14_0_10_37_15]
MKKQYYSTSEVANILRLSRISVFNRIKKGKLKAEKIGRNYIISHDSLVEALGKSIGKERREDIERAVDKATKQYEETFKLLGKE